MRTQIISMYGSFLVDKNQDQYKLTNLMEDLDKMFPLD